MEDWPLVDPMSVGLPRACVLLLTMIWSLACASLMPEQSAVPSERVPIRIEAVRTSKVYFEKAILRLPAGTVYGHLYDQSRPNRPLQDFVFTSKPPETEEFNILITDRMKDLGYEMVDLTDAAFTPENTVMTRFRIVGVVTGLNIDTYRDHHSPNRSYQIARLDMEVRLYDADAKDVVYSQSFHGEARADGINPVAMPPAALMAMEGALADQRFVDLISSKRSNRSSDPEALHVPGCSAVRHLPGDLAEVSKAVVTVRQGSVMGGGVLISPQGHVLTAAHLLGRDEPPRVAIGGVVELDAVVERIDRVVDVAVLKVPGVGYRCAPLDNGPPVAAGVDLFAVGVPIDERLAGTVTRGIVSGRPTLLGQEVLQTDAPLNPGSSGGPVLGAGGQVLGVVSSKYYGVGVEGVGFAVPVDVIRRTLHLEID